jgi:hypothetical protein
MIVRTWATLTLYGNCSGRAGLKEGAVVANGEWSPQHGKEKPMRANTEPEIKKTLQAQASEENER